MGNNKMNSKVIITAALSGAATFKNNNPAVPYTPVEFAEEAHKAYKAGAAMVHALPDGSNFTACGIGREQFPAVTQSCLLGGHMRVGLEDNVHMPGGELARGNWELVEVAVKIAECLGREVATPDDARDIFGLKKNDK